MRSTGSERQDVDAGVATRIIADREQGVSHITQPLSAQRHTRPRDSTLLLWGEAVPCGCTSPCVMTFRHAQALTSHVRPIALVASHAMSQQKGCT